MVKTAAATRKRKSVDMPEGSKRIFLGELSMQHPPFTPLISNQGNMSSGQNVKDEAIPSSNAAF
jgi:hypothetical protein